MNLLKPIIEAFVENGDRYNMLHSAVLGLLDYIRKVYTRAICLSGNYDSVCCHLMHFFCVQENLESLIEYAAESFWDQLVKFERLESIHAFKLMHQQVEKCFPLR